MEKKICFDLDGTLADLYAVDNWLNMLRAYDPTPYTQAEPMLNMSAFARLLHKAQRLGYEIVIISWLSKTNEHLTHYILHYGKKNILCLIYGDYLVYTY